MNQKLKDLKATIIMLELKREYLSFTHKEEEELKKLKEYYNQLAKNTNNNSTK